MLIEIEVTDKNGNKTTQTLDIPVTDIKVDGKSINETGVLQFSGKRNVVVVVNKSK